MRTLAVGESRRPVRHGSRLDRSLAPLAQRSRVGVPPQIPQLVACNECHASLFNDDNKLPPPRAIANRNAIGLLDAELLDAELLDASWAEIAMVTPVYGRGCVVVLQGGGQKALRGHILSVEMDPGSVAEKLPRCAGTASRIASRPCPQCSNRNVNCDAQPSDIDHFCRHCFALPLSRCVLFQSYIGSIFQKSSL